MRTHEVAIQGESKDSFIEFAQAQRARGFQPGVRRTLGHRGSPGACIWKNPNGVPSTARLATTSLGLINDDAGFCPPTQGCFNPGLNCASPLGLNRAAAFWCAPVLWSFSQITGRSNAPEGRRTPRRYRDVLHRHQKKTLSRS